MSTIEIKMHPMMIVAATSVTIASVVAVASMTGYLPGKTSPVAESTANTAVAPLAAVEPAKVEAPIAKAAPETISEVKPKKVLKEKPAKPTATASGDAKQASEQHSTQQAYGNQAQENLPPVAAAPICYECGVVDGVRETRVKQEGSGLGAIAGGVLGGLLGNQVGKGTGKTVATVAAAAGGAYAGHQIERNMGGEKQAEVTIRFDDGSIRTLPQQVAGRWHQGDRVRMSNGQLLPN